MALLEGIPEIGASMGTRCYEEMSHGWSVRGDMSDPAVARDVASAFEETMAFLDRHLLALVGTRVGRGKVSIIAIATDFLRRDRPAREGGSSILKKHRTAPLVCPCRRRASPPLGPAHVKI